MIEVQSGLDQQLVGLAARFLAIDADHSHQPLRQNAIQRGNKIVRIDTHIQESSKHIDHVIRVNRREDEVARQRRLNRNLSGFDVSDFADHDFVRIMTQNRSQTASERETLFFVYWYLRDTADLIFDGIFDRQDLVFLVPDLHQSRHTT